MGELRHGDAIHRVPYGGRIAIHKVLGHLSAGIFLRTYIRHSHGHALHAVICDGGLLSFTAFIPCCHGSAASHIDGEGLTGSYVRESLCLAFLLAWGAYGVQYVAGMGHLIVPSDRYPAGTVTCDAERTFLGGGHLGI